MMATQEFNGLTYTMVDEDTYRDENGGEWVRFEYKDMKTGLRAALKEMKIWAPTMTQDEDAAACFFQADEKRAELEEDMDLLENLFSL